MTRFAIIDAGRVINHAEAEAEFAQSQGWIPAGESRIGDLWDGETFTTPPAPPAPVPQQVTMRQARLALHAAGLLEGVDAAIASLPEPNKTTAKIEWEYAQAVERNAGLVPSLAAALGMTEEQIDQLFISAANL